MMAGNQLDNQIQSDELSMQLLISVIDSWTDDVTFSSKYIAYRAEGNANLVLSISESRQILRLLKCMKDCNEADENELDKLQASVKYVKSFTLLIADEFKVIPQIVELKINDYDAFNKWLLQYRSEERTGKDVRCKYGLLYPDVAYLPDRLSLKQNHDEENAILDTFCIEIKPKQGWTLFKCDPNPFPDIDIENIDKCRYCTMQYWKMKEGKIQKISNFCPIDLFSGYPSRMRKAIKGLIEEPQNNFRLCKNGKLIFDNNTEPSTIDSIVNDIFKENPLATLDEFIELVRLILMKNFNEIDDGAVSMLETESNEKSCNEPSQNYLPTNCILKQILDVQLLSKSNVWSIEDFKETHSNIITSTIRSTRANFVRYLSKKECYILGATALDCSIMLTFQCVSDTNINSLSDDVKKHIVNIHQKMFLVNATVVDVDPKAPDHFAKYIKQTNISHKAYLDALKSNKK